MAHVNPAHIAASVNLRGSREIRLEMMRPRRQTVLEKNSVFSRVATRWVSSAILRLRCAWESWRSWDKFEAERRRVSAFGRRAVDAEDVLRNFPPGSRSKDNLEILKSGLE